MATALQPPFPPEDVELDEAEKKFTAQMSARINETFRLRHKMNLPVDTDPLLALPIASEVLYKYQYARVVRKLNELAETFKATGDGIAGDTRKQVNAALAEINNQIANNINSTISASLERFVEKVTETTAQAIKAQEATAKRLSEQSWFMRNSSYIALLAAAASLFAALITTGIM